MRVGARVAVLLTLPPLLWAGNAVIGRQIVFAMPPLLLNAIRWAGALAILLWLGRRVLLDPAARAQLWARRRHLAALGLFGVAAYNALQYLALTTTTPLNATLIACSSPVWMLAVGMVMHGERPHRWQYLGTVLSIAGVLVVLGRGELAVLARVQFVVGDLLMLLAVFAWAIYSWLLARPPASMRPPQRPDWNWAEFLLAQALPGVVFTWIAAGVETVVAPQPLQWAPWMALALLYVAIGPSIIAFRCWGVGVAEAGPAVAAFFSNLTPLFAALLSAALLGEAPRWYHGTAFALIVAGIVASSRKPATRTP